MRRRRVLCLKFHEYIHESVHRAEQGQLLEKLDSAVGVDDGTQELFDFLGAFGIGGQGGDDDVLAEEVIDHGLHPPGDVVFNDDFLAGDAGDGLGEADFRAGAGAGDARGQAPFLALAIGSVGAGIGVGDAADEHGVAVVGPEAAIARALGFDEAGEVFAQFGGAVGGRVCAGVRAGVRRQSCQLVSHLFLLQNRSLYLWAELRWRRAGRATRRGRWQDLPGNPG